MLAHFHDWLRERRISRLRRQLLRVDPPMRGVIWRVLRREIMNRTPEQVSRMEQDKGLA